MYRMESPAQLESAAEVNDSKAMELETEAFAMAEAGIEAWVLKGAQAKGLREAASAMRQRALLLRQQRASKQCFGFALESPTLLD